jgi:hypothetical protein
MYVCMYVHKTTIFSTPIQTYILAYIQAASATWTSFKPLKLTGESILWADLPGPGKQYARIRDQIPRSGFPKSRPEKRFFSW